MAFKSLIQFSKDDSPVAIAEKLNDAFRQIDNRITSLESNLRELENRVQELE